MNNHSVYVLADADKIIKKIVEEAGIPEEEVRKRIREKIKAFAGLLTEAGAAYAVARELGIDVDIERELAQRVKIKDLKPGMERVDVVARVLRVFPPRVFKRDNRTGKYCRLIIGDETGTIRLTLWNRDVRMVEEGKIEKGDVLEIINGYVREYNGEPVLTLSFDSRILVNPEIEGVERLPEPENVLVKVKDLLPDMNNVDVIVKVIRTFPAKTVKRADGTETTMKAFIGADETGTVRVVLWGDRARVELQEGDIVKITGGYTREGISGISLHIGNLGLIQKRDDLREKYTHIRVSPRTKRKFISELEEGDKFIEVRGTVVQVYDIKPVTGVCRECGAKAEWKDGKWICTECGSEDVRVVPTVSFQIDDGTGTIRAIAFDETARKVYGERISPDLDLHSTAENRLLGEEIVISGYVRRNKYFDSLEIVAKRLSEPNYDKEIRWMKEYVERLLEEQGK